MKEPVLGLYGEDDTGITPDQVKQMEAALKAAGKTAEFHEYPGAPHGFVADYRPSYRKEAAEDAWRTHDRLVQEIRRTELGNFSLKPARRLRAPRFSCLIPPMPAFICNTCGTQFAPSDTGAGALSDLR